MTSTRVAIALLTLLVVAYVVTVIFCVSRGAYGYLIAASVYALSPFVASYVAGRSTR
jgi:hypothetical protein